MRRKYYVGIRPGAQRAVFYMAVLAPTPELCPQYSAVIGPFRTKRGAQFMAEHGAGTLTFNASRMPSVSRGR